LAAPCRRAPFNEVKAMSVDVKVGRLFRRSSGRSLMVAFDRTFVSGPTQFAIDARAALKTIVDTGPEAVLISPGLIKQCGDLFAFHGAPAIVARIDAPLLGDFRVDGVEFHRMVCDPERAALLGADAVVMCLVDGYDDPREYLRNLTAVAEAAKRSEAVGLPLIVEAVLWGNRHKDQKDAARLAAMCRISAELGADLIKTQYPGTPEGMRTITEGCPVPVLVLGGPASDDMRVVEAFTKGALAGGAKGAIFGRNIWQRKDVAAMAAAIGKILHGA
jgi:class I fructose-bisphosphate aldolase